MGLFSFASSGSSNSSSSENAIASSSTTPYTFSEPSSNRSAKPPREHSSSTSQSLTPNATSFSNPPNDDTTSSSSGHGPPGLTVVANKLKLGNIGPVEIHISPAYHSMIAGAGAGLVSSIVTCPLDVVKTRLQAQIVSKSAKDYEGVSATVMRILKQSGIKGMYRGLGPTIMGYLPTWGIYFSVYDAVKQELGDQRLGGGGGPGHPSNDAWWIHILAAMSAGATGTIVTNPLWVIKTRFMAQAVMKPSEARYRHTLDAIQTIYRQEGLRAFYKGLAPSLMGVSHVAVQFPLYEQLKVWAAPPDNSPLQPSTILLCSALSKMVASLATYPHEVLRTRLQIHNHSSAPTTATAMISPTTAPLLFQPGGPSPALVSASQVEVDDKGKSNGKSRTAGFVDTFKNIAKQDGWKGFYRGLSINLIRTVPNSAVTMLTYELIMRKLTTMT